MSNSPISQEDARDLLGSRRAAPTSAALQTGNLIVVSAPSGSGKSSMVERVLKRVDRLRYSISYTTRSPRGAEKDGVHYYFRTKSEFVAMRDKGEFLEFAEVHGNLYGTHKDTVQELQAQGFDVILDIDVQGARQICRQMSSAITVFILPPSRDVLAARLRLRNLNDPADLERRLRDAAEEVRSYNQFSYVVVNEDLDRASAALEAIINAERHRRQPQEKMVSAIIGTFRGESIHA